MPCIRWKAFSAVLTTSLALAVGILPQPSEAQVPGSGTSIALGTALDAVPEALVLGVTLRAGGSDLALVIARSLANVPEALSETAGMRLASRSSTYVLILWRGTTLVTAAITALAFY